MGSVTSILGCIPADITVVGAEIIAIDIIHEAVSIIIDARKTGELSRIGPHIGLKVRMSMLYSIIHHCNYDRRVTAYTPCPDIPNIDVSSCESIGCKGRISIIDIMPLGGEGGIVERQNITLGIRFGRRNGLKRMGHTVGGTGSPAAKFNNTHL